MNISIKNIEARRLAVLEHRGDPQKVDQSVNKLIAWAKNVRMKNPKFNLKPGPGDAFGFAYDDPKTTPANDFRFDLALTIPPELDLKSETEIVERQLPAGRYVVAVHKGPHDTIGDTVYSLYRDWLPHSNEELGDLPCIFCYYNFDNEVPENELITECWLLLKDK